MTTIALIDDHKIFCDSLEGLINDFDGFKAIWCAQDGRIKVPALTTEEDDNRVIQILQGMKREQLWTKI